MENQSFSAVITREASKEMTKSNGANYVLHNAEITEEGPLKGKIVTCSRSLTNKDGDIKKGVEVDQEVTLWLQVVTGPDGNKKPFFEVQAGDSANSDEDILTALGFDVKAQTI